MCILFILIKFATYKLSNYLVKLRYLSVSISYTLLARNELKTLSFRLRVPDLLLLKGLFGNRNTLLGLWKYTLKPPQKEGLETFGFCLARSLSYLIF